MSQARSILQTSAQFDTKFQVSCCRAHVTGSSCRYDFLLDADMTPWLLEINCSPTFEHSTPVTAQLVRDVSEDVIKVTVDLPAKGLGSFGRMRSIAAQRPSTPRTSENLAQAQDHDYLFGRSGANMTRAYNQAIAHVDTGKFVCILRDAPVDAVAAGPAASADTLALAGRALKPPPRGLSRPNHLCLAAMRKAWPARQQAHQRSSTTADGSQAVSSSAHAGPASSDAGTMAPTAAASAQNNAASCGVAREHPWSGQAQLVKPMASADAQADGALIDRPPSATVRQAVPALHVSSLHGPPSSRGSAAALLDSLPVPPETPPSAPLGASWRSSGGTPAGTLRKSGSIAESATEGRARRKPPVAGCRGTVLDTRGKHPAETAVALVQAGKASAASLQSQHQLVNAIRCQIDGLVGQLHADSNSAGLSHAHDPMLDCSSTAGPAHDRGDTSGAAHPESTPAPHAGFSNSLKRLTIAQASAADAPTTSTVDIDHLLQERLGAPTISQTAALAGRALSLPRIARSLPAKPPLASSAAAASATAAAAARQDTLLHAVADKRPGWQQAARRAMQLSRSSSQNHVRPAHGSMRSWDPELARQAAERWRTAQAATQAAKARRATGVRNAEVAAACQVHELAMTVPSRMGSIEAR